MSTGLNRGCPSWRRARAVAALDWPHPLWLLPGGVGSSSDNALATRMVADQQRLAGPTGASPAAQKRAEVASRSALREREAPTLARALDGWKPLAR